MDPTSPAFYSQDGLLVEVYDNQTIAEWEASQNDVPFYLEEAKVAGGLCSSSAAVPVVC